MRILKPKGVELELDGNKYNLLFNINAIDEIQEHYDLYIVDVINSILERENKEIQKNSYNVLIYVLRTLINESVKRHNRKSEDKQEEITEEYLKENIDNATSIQLAVLILKAFNGSMPKSEDESPNVKSEQAKK